MTRMNHLTHQTQSQSLPLVRQNQYNTTSSTNVYQVSTFVTIDQVQESSHTRTPTPSARLRPPTRKLRSSCLMRSLDLYVSQHGPDAQSSRSGSSRAGILRALRCQLMSVDVRCDLGQVYMVGSAGVGMLGLKRESGWLRDVCCRASACVG